MRKFSFKGFMTNDGNYEPPWQKTLNAYVDKHDEVFDPGRRDLALLKKKEQKYALAASSKPQCSVCLEHCRVVDNPWLDASTLVSRDGDSGHVHQIPHGIQLPSCKHNFCGRCLAQVIYHRLNIIFDPKDYGQVLETVELATPGRSREFPIFCPSCQAEPGGRPVELNDMIALLVLGGPNMSEWRHTRYLIGLNLIYCPYNGCDGAFDATDIVSNVQHTPELVQCPKCRGFLCKSCKSAWHENLPCEVYRNRLSGSDLATLAQQRKWKQCPNCTTMVELEYGCNHIQCACNHHFCYSCSAPFEHTNGRYRCTGGMGCRVWEEQNLLTRR